MLAGDSAVDPGLDRSPGYLLVLDLPVATTGNPPRSRRAADLDQTSPGWGWGEDAQSWRGAANNPTAAIGITGTRALIMR